MGSYGIFVKQKCGWDKWVYVKDFRVKINAFRLPQTHSSNPVQRQFYGWATNFHRWLKSPPTHPLNPINPDNARILRITAAAGTELADAYS